MKVELPNDIFGIWVPPSYLKWYLAALLIFVLILVFFLVKKYWRKKQENKVTGEPKLSFDTFMVLLDQARWQLKDSDNNKLVIRKESVRIVDCLADTIKAFISWRLDLKLADKTTGEIKRLSVGLPEEKNLGEATSLLTRCDQVKFEDDEICLNPDEAALLIKTAEALLRKMRPALYTEEGL